MLYPENTALCAYLLEYISVLSSWVFCHTYLFFHRNHHLPKRTSFFKGCPFQGDPLQTDWETSICLYLPWVKQTSQFSSLVARKTTSNDHKHSRLLRAHSMCKNNQVHIYFVCLLVLEHFESTWVILSNSFLLLGACTFYLQATWPSSLKNAHAFLWLRAKEHRRC